MAVRTEGDSWRSIQVTLRHGRCTDGPMVVAYETSSEKEAARRIGAKTDTACLTVNVPRALPTPIEIKL
jgi:protein involved in temperature-dependent protein secretion